MKKRIDEKRGGGGGGGVSCNKETLIFVVEVWVESNSPINIEHNFLKRLCCGRWHGMHFINVCMIFKSFPIHTERSKASQEITRLYIQLEEEEEFLVLQMTAYVYKWLLRLEDFCLFLK